jgi:dTDP-glucose 4,6-dehydratase
MVKYAISGGTGFVGRHLIPFLLSNPDNEVISIERLSEHNTKEQDRLEILLHDFRAEFPDWAIDRLKDVDYIIHNGGAVQAIKSLENPHLYIESNIVGTYNMLEMAKKVKPKLFLYTSSAEAFGACPEGYSFKETDKMNPSTPYSSSKASAEMLVNVYNKSFGVPTIIAKSMNLFGTKRGNETYIPNIINNIKQGNEVTVHVGANGEFGIRQWIDVDTYIDALMFLINNGQIGETYNIAGYEQNNLEIVRRISKILGIPSITKLVDVTLHHPAHDLRFSIDDSKIRELGWKPSISFDDAFEYMVRNT